MATDTKWQKMPRARRAAVYRAIGHAAREARESGEPELQDDIRVVMNVLRAHAKGTTKRGPKKKR
jgi:hypothetical protein